MSQRTFVQIAYFVEDVRLAAEYWSQNRGAGPFIVMENIPLTSVLYRGSPAELDHSSAYGQLGNIMVELVQQNNTGPSAFRDMFPEGQSGLHHMAQFADDLELELDYYREQGFEIALTARAGDVSFAFVDTRRSLGHMVELYQDCDAIRSFYAMVADIARTAQPGQVFATLPTGENNG